MVDGVDVFGLGFRVESHLAAPLESYRRSLRLLLLRGLVSGLGFGGLGFSDEGAGFGVGGSGYFQVLWGCDTQPSMLERERTRGAAP